MPEDPVTNPSIWIKLNGQKKELTPPVTLEALLRLLETPREKVAVEHNLEIVPREELGQRELRDGDEVEVVHFVGGGAVKKPRKRKSASAGTNHKAKALVIVESPTKCKTIYKYLGADYEIAASMGHVIDLPRSEMGIDIEKNFEPKYIVVRDRKKTFSELKKKAKNKEAIYLACDPDREGEAISWHLSRHLADGKKHIARVVFNEITKDAVREAFAHPAEINMRLVNAQQARRVLDRLVGYSLSPLLWQKVGRGLSAGRVQSVALRMIVDQEKKIKAFVPQEYWTVEAELCKQKGDTRPFTAKLEKIGKEKAELKDEKRAAASLARIEKERFVVNDVKRQKRKRNPYPPFTTSKLQQAAYNVLRFPAAKTMRTAQMLYEGIDIGEEGSIGLITYMRTDSVRLSAVALEEAREVIVSDYGKEYLPEKPNVYKSKKQAQEAHEAIRPASFRRSPEAIKRYLTGDQYKLYSLIWRQALSSQMTPALISQETVSIAAGDCFFKATGSRVEFPGFLKTQGASPEKDNPLPHLAAGEALNVLKLEKLQHFTKPPPRFTDASLVKALEEEGIGRPSTYAPTISTLVSRHYIHREGGSLFPTELGTIVINLLVQYFSKLLDFKFTAKMEEELDEVEEGNADWVSVVKDFYGVFSNQVDFAKSEMKVVKRASEPTDEVCEKCGKAMVIKLGRRGRFMSCSGWPECKNAKSIPTTVDCPQCKKGKLVKRRARSGRGRAFYGCTTYPDCTFITNRLPKPEEGPPQTDPSQKPAEDSNTP